MLFFLCTQGEGMGSIPSTPQTELVVMPVTQNWCAVRMPFGYSIGKTKSLFPNIGGGNYIRSATQVTFPITNPCALLQFHSKTINDYWKVPSRPYDLFTGSVHLQKCIYAPYCRSLQSACLLRSGDTYHGRRRPAQLGQSFAWHKWRPSVLFLSK